MLDPGETVRQTNKNSKRSSEYLDDRNLLWVNSNQFFSKANASIHVYISTFT